jgi:hypothetical protein
LKNKAEDLDQEYELLGLKFENNGEYFDEALNHTYPESDSCMKRNNLALEKQRDLFKE